MARHRMVVTIRNRPWPWRSATHHIAVCTISKRIQCVVPRSCLPASPPWRLALSPGLADARAGGGSSFGSRGEHDLFRAAVHQHGTVFGVADAAEHDAAISADAPAMARRCYQGAPG